MSILSPHLNKRSLTHAVLVLVAALIFIAVLTGLNEWLNIGDTVAFWGLFLVGLALCMAGPLGDGAAHGWRNPLHIAGYILGTIILLLGAAILFDTALPGISAVQSAIVVLGALMIVKGVVAMFYKKMASGG
jgi:hypothetical protein